MLHGDRKDRINTSEPKPSAVGRVAVPRWLDRKAAAVWRRLAPDLTAKGLLTPWDVDAFAVLCDAVARHAEAAELVAGTGVLVMGDKDRPTANPAVALVARYAGLITTYGGRFGLTPSDRAQIKMPRADLSDDLLS